MSRPPATGIATRPGIRPYAWYVIGVLLIASTFSYLDRLVLSLLIDPIKADLQLSDTEVSLLAGFAFAACYIVFAFPFGRWVDTRGRRNVAAIGIALWSLATMACGLTASFGGLFVARMFVGVGEASIGPASASMVPDIVPPSRRSLAMAVLTCGVTMGGGLAYLLGGYFIQWANAAHPVLPFLGEIAPWKIAFIAAGAPGVLLALLIWATVREPARHTTASALDSQTPGTGEVLAYVKRHGVLFALMFAGYCGYSINGYAYNVWGPAFLQRLHGLGPADAGLFMGIAYAGGCTGGVLLGGMIADALVRRGMIDAPIRIGLWSIWLQVPLFLGAYLVPDTSVALICFALGIVISGLMAGQQTVMIQMLTPNRMRGTVTAIYLVCVNLTGLGIAPTLIALVSDHLYGGPSHIGAALATVTAPALLIAYALISLALPRARARTEALVAG